MCNLQYISTPCNGSTFSDSRLCSSCAYGTNRTRGSLLPTLATTSCPGVSFVINECTDGYDTADESACSSCNSNCEAANFSRGRNGQYIAELCSGQGSKDNTCARCSGRCASFATRAPGQYILGFCTGMTQFDRSCADCRLSCEPGEYIAGPRCNGESARDTTSCQRCTPDPSEENSYPVFTRNPCTGTTTEDQVWEYCEISCMEGEYMSKVCSTTSAAECSPCRTACPDGYYMQGSCDGTTNYDSVQCIPCRDCSFGQYRHGLETCNGTAAQDTVECRRCSSGCTEGQYAFAICSGKGGFDETSCKECTVCERDFPGQYNSIYGSCNGTQSQDVVSCLLNPPSSSYVGDACPANHVSYGKLDAIDTELRGSVYASLLLPLSKNVVSVVYEAVVARVQQTYGASHVLQNGDWMIVSKSIRWMANGAELVSNTRAEVFKVCCFLF